MPTSTPDERSKCIMEIMAQLPDVCVETGSIQLALNRAYEAGERRGYGAGVVDGQRHLAEVFNRLLLGAPPCSAP
jgi:hypothetical protein